MLADLQATGQLIWNAYRADTLDAGSQALIREFARCADTLDRLDDLARGRQETWVSLARDEMGEIHVSVDKILDQRRNHQLALRAIHAEIRQAGIKPVGVEGKSTDEKPEEDMLARMRRLKAERERQSG